MKRVKGVAGSSQSTLQTYKALAASNDKSYIKDLLRRDFSSLFPLF
jgi:hypothetical protein